MILFIEGNQTASCFICTTKSKWIRRILIWPKLTQHKTVCRQWIAISWLAASCFVCHFLLIRATTGKVLRSLLKRGAAELGTGAVNNYKIWLRGVAIYLSRTKQCMMLNFMAQGKIFGIFFWKLWIKFVHTCGGKVAQIPKCVLWNHN